MITNNFQQINRVVFEVVSQKPWSKPELTIATLTQSRVEQLQFLDHKVTQFLKEYQLYDSVWQCPVVLIPCAPISNTQSVVLRPVDSTEAMTANFSQLPQRLLTILGNSLLSEEHHHEQAITSILYDVTNKPPGTIEWE